jgi:hypothetical protein
VQEAVASPWTWTFEGCHTHRDTGATIRDAGFSSVDYRDIVVPTAFVPFRSEIAGVAIK